MDIACSLSRSNAFQGADVTGCKALERLNSRTSLKYRHLHCKLFGDLRTFSNAKSPNKFKKNISYSLRSACLRSRNEGNFWPWYYSSNGSSFYDSGNDLKNSKHVGLSRCQGNESVAYVNGNGRDVEAIETGGKEVNPESNSSEERSGEEGGDEVPSLEELRESLQKALKDLEAARLNSTMLEYRRL
ncbi:UNVERIFIED_CONTAM: K(+) efflux antiporter 2, chloroplastic [Sesamum angustifolium]|uniref:K(+) efflux antiporter 2, chloroplastic n=1 Tax=Sesamum angustifolium TaxID=2727405 RepID=A0AAW2RHJ1_9LAMI